MAGRIRSSWLSLSRWHKFFLVVKVGAAIWTSYWLFRSLPPPGYAIGVVAVVAALMSLQQDMAGWQKSIWIILIGALLIVEMRSIKVDRNRADLQSLDDRKSQDHNFMQLREQQDREFGATLGRLHNQLQATISGFENTRRLENQHFGGLLHEQARLFSGMQQSTRDTLNALTGGDSYGVIFPVLSQPSGKTGYPLMITVRGKNVLWDVRIDMKEGPIDSQYEASHISQYFSGKQWSSTNLGAVSTTYGAPTGFLITPSRDMVNTYRFWVWSRTKLTTEELAIRYNEAKGVWEPSWKVYRAGEIVPLEELKWGESKVTTRPE